MQHTASFTDGHIQSDVESASGGGDTSSYIQRALESDVIDPSSPKPESVLCASPPKPESVLSEENEFIECPMSSSPSNSFVSPPTSLPLTQQQQSDARCRNADRLSPRRAVATMVCSDSLPAVAEEPVAYRDETDEVFDGAEEASLNRSMEVVAPQGEDAVGDAEPIPSKLTCTLVKNITAFYVFRQAMSLSALRFDNSAA